MTEAERDLLLAVSCVLACWGTEISVEERKEACAIAGVPYEGKPSFGADLTQHDILALMRAVAAER